MDGQRFTPADGSRPARRRPPLALRRATRVRRTAPRRGTKEEPIPAASDGPRVAAAAGWPLTAGRLRMQRVQHVVRNRSRRPVKAPAARRRCVGFAPEPLESRVLLAAPKVTAVLVDSPAWTS